jgi:class 3 adenylate cyclase
LYNSGIIPEIIALQMDMSKEEVLRIIERVKKEQEDAIEYKNQNKTTSSSSLAATETKIEDRKKYLGVPLISKVQLDKTVNIDYAIKHAQLSMWKALKVKPDFDISMEETQNALKNYAESKATFVILHVDLVDSTKLSMTLPIDRLTTIIQAFAQELSLVISSYGGYVLKYIGDAILAFFIVDSQNDLYFRCINAVECGCTMLKIVRQGINPILNQSDYPELRIRIGIDVGKNAVVKFGWNTHTLDGKVIAKAPHFDILGYTISIATKMTAFAKPDQIVIGQLVYDVLKDEQKSTFRLLPISPNIWDYFSNITGGIYNLYGTLNEMEDDQ